MAELRVWDRRLSAADLARVKGRILRVDEPGLIGCWRMHMVADDYIPSHLATGYPGRTVGGLMVTTIPAIDRFLVPGELEKEADLAYSRGETAFLAGDFEKATHGFEEALSYVASFRGAEGRQVTAQRQWDLSVADAAYTEAEARLAAGDPVRAYWAFDQAVNKVPDYKDATSRREQALTDATYSVGLSILLSEQIKETLAPATPEGGKWSRLTSSIDRAGRLDLASRRDIYSAYQARIYGMVAEELRIGGLPYVRFVERLEMDRLVSASGVTASRAHLDQVVAACRSREIPVLLVGELTSAYTKRESSTSNRVFWTVNKEEYTDEKGKNRTREVEGRAYRAERVQASSEMACELSYRLINVASGSVVGEGVVSADDRDEVDYITWNRRDGVEPQNLRVKDGKGFKRLSPSDRNVMDKRTVLRTDEDLFLEGAPALSRELVASVIGSLRYYTP